MRTWTICLLFFKALGGLDQTHQRVTCTRCDPLKTSTPSPEPIFQDQVGSTLEQQNI